MSNTEIIGLVAAAFTAVATLPQLLKIIKEKKATNVSIAMVLVLITGLVLWIIYGVKRQDIPLIISNALSVLINILLLIFAVIYKKKNAS